MYTLTPKNCDCHVTSSNPDGTCSYDRHKIFLYKEDFAKFAGGLQEVIDFIRRSKPEFFEQVAEKA